MSEKNKGIVFIIVSAFCFACMNIFVRLSGDLPSVQKSFFRNFIAMLFALAMMRQKGIGWRMGRGDLKFMIARAGFGTLGILCNFYAVDHLKVADASMLNKLSPFFVIIFSLLILREKVRPYQALCVLVAFVGTLFVIKPGAPGSDVFPYLIGICGGMTAGLAYTFVRLLGNRGVKGPYIVFFFSAFSCVVTLPSMIFSFHPMSVRQVLMLLGAGMAAAGGQFSITIAYTHAPGREISIYDYSQIIFITLLSFFILGEIPDALSFVGYAVIISASLLMFLLNRRADAKSVKADADSLSEKEKG